MLNDVKRALVVGASGAIGAAFTRLLLASPQLETVVASAREPDTSEALQALAERDGRLVCAPLDITVEASVAAAAEHYREALSPLDFVINCTGVLHAGDTLRPEKRLADIEPANLVRAFEVNTLGPVLIAKHFARMMPRSERCVFASLSARVGSIGDNRLGGWYAYRASKAALNMMTRTVAVELQRRHRGVIVVSLHPGTVTSALSEPFARRDSGRTLFTPDQSAAYLATVIDDLTTADNGGFFAWDGKPVEW